MTRAHDGENLIITNSRVRVELDVVEILALPISQEIWNRQRDTEMIHLPSAILVQLYRIGKTSLAGVTGAILNHQCVLGMPMANTARLTQCCRVAVRIIRAALAAGVRCTQNSQGVRRVVTAPVR